MLTILCYGDSNTWGFVPGSFNLETMYMERYSRQKRWTGMLQHLLGSEYYVVEEGLNGRTTNIEYEDTNDRSGKAFLPVCLYTHAPINLVIIMLGINDLKKELNRTIEDITQGIKELIEIIKSTKYGADMQSEPHILLVSPPIPSNESYEGDMFINAIERAQQFAKNFKALAIQFNCHFFDAAPHIKLSDIDGIHFDDKAHEKFARILYDEIKKINL